MIIKARNLSKKVIFNGEEINILDKIDLDISSNTSLAVVGPSGSGKSTLLGLLAGLDSPSGGKDSLTTCLFIPCRKIAAQRSEKNP